MTQTSGSLVDDSVDTGSGVILSAQNLRKSYGAREALKGLTFSLAAGRVLGFLGPNGAGKTTSIRILTTILAPTSGRFVVDGISSEQPEKIRRRIGVLPEGLGFPRQQTGTAYLTFFGQLYGRSTAQARTTSAELLEVVGLQNRGGAPIGSYSHGMRQRIGIARALVNDPAVVFLDEPTLGLDPRGQRELLLLIGRIAHEHGKGVVLCSHLLSEIEGVCDDVVIMNAGQVVAKGTVEEVIGRSDGNGRRLARVHVPVESVPTARAALLAMPGDGHTVADGDAAGWLTVEFTPAAVMSTVEEQRAKNAVLEALVQAEVPVLSFDGGAGRLQDVFLQLTAEAIE
jgi:ABC-2 type transport system ATP-binding protein